MTARQQALIDIYSTAQQGLYETIAKKTAKGSSIAYQNALLKEVNEILATLQADSKEWSEVEIPKAYDKAMSASQAHTADKYNLTGKQYTELQTLTQAQFTGLNTKAIEALVDSNIGRSSIANAGLAKNLNNAIKQKFAQGLTAKETQKILVEEIFGINGQGKLVINGRKYDPTKYADMFARSAIKETQNTAAFNEAKSVGSDIMEMSSHSSACEICQPLEGRWYSLNRDGDYPYIYSTAWKGGHKLPHPRCEHTFTTVILALEDKDTITAQKKKAKNPTDPLPRTDAKLKAYNADQKAKAKLWSDKQQYERMKSRLGEENVPKSFSGFRRMKNADGDNWKALQANYRSAGAEIKKIQVKPFSKNSVEYHINAFSVNEQNLIKGAISDISSKYPIATDITVGGKRLDALGQAIIGMYQDKKGKVIFNNNLLIGSNYSEKTYRIKGFLSKSIESTAQHEYLHILNSQMTMQKLDDVALKYIGQDVKLLNYDDIMKMKEYNKTINTASDTVFATVYKNVRNDFPKLSQRQFDDLVADTFGTYALKDEAEFVCEGISYINTGKVKVKNNELAGALEKRFEEMYYNANIN